MKIITAAGLSPAELRSILKKPAFDEIQLGDRAQNRIRQTFGANLTAAAVVEQIVTDVRKEGLPAVLRYTELIDGAALTGQTIEVSSQEYDAAYAAAAPDVVESIRRAVANVRAYHAEQLPKSWITYRNHGAMLGQNCLPLERAGLYVPGGTAAYPSSVIMNAVPAAIAGVGEIVMTAPPAADGSLNPYVLIAAREAGVHRVFKIGGAQAVAALAFGAGPVPKVDKITGPGNIFVTLAKKAVYGYCDIDMLAGPSEILIIADQTADPAYVAADMLSQAEHDVLASSILITDSAALAEAAKAELTKQLTKLERREIAAASLERQGLIIVAGTLQQAVELANIAAPEHLELLTAEPFKLLPFIRNAGAVFMGPYSPEPLGDYFAGPNHVLPTGGTARFYSVLNVETFMKRTSIICYTEAALRQAAPDVIRLAEAEGLGAHAAAIKVRGL